MAARQVDAPAMCKTQNRCRERGDLSVFGKVSRAMKPPRALAAACTALAARTMPTYRLFLQPSILSIDDPQMHQIGENRGADR